MRPSEPQNSVEMGLYHTVYARLHVSNMDGISPRMDNQHVSIDALAAVPVRLQLWSLLRQVSTSCREMRVLSTGIDIDISPPVFEIQLLNTLEAALSVDSRLTTWERGTYGHHRYNTVFTDQIPVDSQLRFASRMHFFSDIQCGAKWLSYWGSQIYLLQSVIVGIDLARERGADCASLIIALPTRDACQARVLAAVDNVCSSVAFMLGEIDSQGMPSLESKGQALGAYFLLQALRIAIGLDGVSAAQLDWISDCLLKIAHVWGIRMALHLRDSTLSKKITIPVHNSNPIAV